MLHFHILLILLLNWISLEWIEKGILTFDAAQKMQRIWLDSGVQICYGKGSEYGLGDSAAYFLNALDRISIPNYIPTEQDLLRTRTRTTGIVEIQFRYKVLPNQIYLE